MLLEQELHPITAICHCFVAPSVNVMDRMVRSCTTMETQVSRVDYGAVPVNVHAMLCLPWVHAVECRLLLICDVTFNSRLSWKRYLISWSLMFFWNIPYLTWHSKDIWSCILYWLWSTWGKSGFYDIKLHKTDLNFHVEVKRIWGFHFTLSAE